MTAVSTAVVTRAEDGIFQPMLLQPLSRGQGTTTVYRLTGCVLRKVGKGSDGPPIITLSDLADDVFIFVNVPLEAANHLFVEALAQCALLEDSGIASGVLIDQKRRIVHSGFEHSPDGEPKDQYAGQLFHSKTFDGARQVSALSPHFFAVRRDRLLTAGGLSVVSSRRMQQLLQRLRVTAQASGLQLWVTPDAVATLAASHTNRNTGSLEFGFQQRQIISHHLTD